MTKNKLTPWERVALARKADRPKALDYINLIFTDFMELHGDRLFADDKSIIGGIGLLNEIPVTVIGQQKGKTTSENIERNFGMTNPEGYRKALRLMKQAEKFNRPIITFIDTPGAYPGIGAEERGQGEATSGGALAIGVGNKIIMLENAVYSILSPEGFASILYKDASKAPEAAEKMKITASDLKKMNIIDTIISEPEGGAQNDLTYVANQIKEALIKDLETLNKMSKEELQNDRYNKFRKIGNLN